MCLGELLIGGSATGRACALHLTAVSAFCRPSLCPDRPQSVVVPPTDIGDDLGAVPAERGDRVP